MGDYSNQCIKSAFANYSLEYPNANKVNLQSFNFIDDFCIYFPPNQVNSKPLSKRVEHHLPNLIISAKLLEMVNADEIQCNICCERVMNVRGARNREILRNHFADFHKIFLPHIFHFWDGSGNFSLKEAERGLTGNKRVRLLMCEEMVTIIRNRSYGLVVDAKKSAWVFNLDHNFPRRREYQEGCAELS